MWQLLKGTVIAFIHDEALSRGAAIAFYTVTSIAPLLLIVIAVAGLVFGEDAAQGAITAQLGGLMGQQTAEVLQSAVANAATKSSGVLATIIGLITILVTASGVFVEMQSSLNAIWKAKWPPLSTSMSLFRSMVSQVAQQPGQVHFRVSGLEAALQRGLEAALGHGVAHALAEEIGIATEVFSRRERDRREDWRLVLRKIPTSIRPVRNYDEASLGAPCNGSFSIVQQAN